MRLATIALAFGLVLGLPACDGGDPVDPAPPADLLDGSPRLPDDEGVATALTFDSITLDGKRTYDVSEHLVAFSTYTLDLEPMIGRRGQYVQIGVVDGTMIWMAGLGAPIPLEDRLVAYYSGVVTRIEGRRVAFDDGTVLTMSDDLEPPAVGALVQAEIDTTRHVVVELVERAEPLPTTTTTTAPSPTEPDADDPRDAGG